MADWTGRQIGKFEVKEILGRGGMGEVYRAFHPTLERDVAIKTIHTHMASDPLAVDRFRREAKVVAALRHAGIVQVHDFDVEDDTCYMVMEFVPGQSLQQRLNALYQQSDRLPLSDTLPLFQSIIQAVAYAHNQGVIHRDLKPANVLLTVDGQPILADFGLSKIISSERLTATGEILGTPQYMAPEQISGEPSDARVDVYALGVMFYEMATGVLPFHDDSPAMVILKHMTEPPAPPRAVNPDLPLEIEQVIQKCLAKEPAERYTSAQELLEAIEALRPAAKGKESVATVTDDGRCPFRGLQTFEAEHAEFFFGREALIEQLVETLTTLTAGQSGRGTGSRFQAVLGASGSGKSSLVRAGLVPAIERGAVPGSEGWRSLVIKPGSRPLEELAAQLVPVLGNDGDRLSATRQLLDNLAADGRALHLAVRLAWSEMPPEQQLLLVIDQFEELFTLCHDETERLRFIENLLYAAATGREGRTLVIVTMRADFYHRCAAYRELASLISAQQVLVGPMNETELRRAIERPAREVGLRCEVGLVELILADVAQQPGALPLLQHALLELWEQRQGGMLTLEAYRNSGGVASAIAQRADSLYNTFDLAEQAIVRRVMLRLTQPGEGTEDTRRRVRKAELVPEHEQGDAVETVIQQLVDDRLVTTTQDKASGEEMVDVAHEALIRGWERLRGWLDEDRAALRTHRRLTDAAEEWERNQRDESYLYHGIRLAETEAWTESHSDELNELERTFLTDSLAERERAAQEQEAQQQRELETAQKLAEEAEARRQAEEQHAEEAEARAQEQSQSARRLRWLAVGLAVFLLAAIGAAWFAFNQQAVAQRNAAEAQNQALISGSQAALVNGNTDEAIALAIEAVRLSPQSIGAQVALGEAAYAPGTMRRLLTPEGIVSSMEFSADGQTVLTSNWDQPEIRLRNMQNGEIIRRFEGHQGGTTDAVFTSDGRTALSVSEDHTLILWDVATGAIIRQFEGHLGWVNDVALSPDGQTALSGADEDTTPILWDMQTGEIVRHFGADGEGHTDGVRSVAFSPDGLTALTGSNDATMILWDVSTGQVVRRFNANGEGHAASIVSLDFSPDGSQVLSAAEETVIILWDVATGEVLRRFQGHSGWANQVAFSADGQQVLSAGGDNSVILWDVASGQPINRFKGHEEYVQSAVFSPDGRTVYSGSGDNTIRIWDLDGGQVIRRFAGHMGWAFRAVRSPDGRQALTSSVDGTAILWDIETGREIRRYTSDVPIANASFAPDGRTALLPTGFMIDEPYDVVLWDIETGEEIRRLTGHPDGVVSTAFSPDGQKAVSGGATGTIILWDVATGQETRRFAGYEADYFVGPSVATHSLAFSPDGQTLLSGFGNGTLVLWDVATGREIRQFEGHTFLVGQIIFSPDGQHAFSGAWDNTAIYWDVASGEIVHRFTDHSAAVYQVALTPDGRYGLGGSADNTTTLWDMETGDVIRRYSGSNADVFSIAFGPDGRDAVVTFFDGGVELWRIDSSLNELVTWTENNRYIPDLTCKQRGLYKLEPLCAEE